MDNYDLNSVNHPEPHSGGAKSLVPWNWSHVIGALIIAVAGILLIPLSPTIYYPVRDFLQRLPLNSYFATAVQFGTVTTTILIGCAIYVLDKKCAVLLTYLAAALLINSVAINAVKEISGRSRPNWGLAMSHKHQRQLVEYSLSHGDVPVSAEKSDHWYGPVGQRPWFKDWFGSFPSGHAAGAFVLVAFLTALYPQGRRLWLVIGVSCALSRVWGERHYLEDVMVGGAIGWTVSYWVFSWQWPYRLGIYLVGRRARKETQPEKAMVELDSSMARCSACGSDVSLSHID